MGEFEEKLNGILNNPQEMEKIISMARGLMGGGSGPDPPPQADAAPLGGLNLGDLLGGIDPGLIEKLARGLGGGMGSAALLQSITPHLKDTRQSQLKRAIMIAQMVRVARAYFSE